MLQSKARKIAGMVPHHLKAIMSQLEDVTKSGQDQTERTHAYMAVMESLDAATRNELIQVLQRVQDAIEADASRTGNRKQRRLMRRGRK